MKYLYYPGCSQEGSALEYSVSTLTVLKALGTEIEEIKDWTCCGASAAPVMSDLLGVVLPARNLALAERADGDRDMLAVCSACYTNFRRTNAAIAATPTLRARINQALEVENLTYQ